MPAGIVLIFVFHFTQRLTALKNKRMTVMGILQN